MIRALTADDAAAYAHLRRAMLQDAPLAFASSPADDRASNPDAARAFLSSDDDAAVLGAFDGDALVGAVGLYRDRHQKAAHKAHIWGMFVTPSHRGRRLGRQLLDAVLAHAATLDGVAWAQLGVSSSAPAARALYESAGFAVWGTEPDALRHEGRSATHHHMALRLDDGDDG